MSEQYNYEYYHNCCGPIAYENPEHWTQFFGMVADRIVADLKPRTVLDAGCAMGYLVAALRDRGVEAYGIDISQYAISKVREDIRPYCVVGSLTEPLPQTLPSTFDLVVTIEVLEHLYAEDGAAAIANLCNCADRILFSSTPDDFMEETHVNVQQREYWARLFAERGFLDDLNYRPTYITPYSVCYRRSDNILRQVEDYERNIRRTESQHAHTILEWRGAVNDREQIIQDKNTLLEQQKAECASRLLETELHYQTLLTEKDAQHQAALTEKDAQHQAALREQEERCRTHWEQLLQVNSVRYQNQLEQAENTARVRTAEWEAANNALSVELDHHRDYCQALIVQCQEANRQVLEYQIMYDVIANSTCWKLTKPVRVVLDWVKKCLKSNHYTHLVCKGLKCLKQNGIRYTWERVKNRKEHQKVVRQMLQEAVQASAAPVDESIQFSILVPLYNTPAQFLREMIESVIAQTYSNWELCLGDASTTSQEVEQICLEYSRKDSRIKYKKLEENFGISGNTNACAEMAEGHYIALLDHDDILMPNALEENAKAIAYTEADVLYSDEDHLSLQGEHINPFYKPDWSPDLLYSQMYICHLLVFRRDLFRQIGGFRFDFDGSQDYDLMLRLSEVTERICHIPRILYSWRESPSSTAANADAKPYAHLAGKRALDEHLKRKYGQQAYAEETEYTFVFSPRFALPEETLISIIIPMKDHWEMSDACIRSILEKSSYRNYEILILDNRSEKKETAEWFERIRTVDPRIRVLDADMEFNWSKLNNYGISHARGDVFVLLNNDTLVISPDWLERLAENALREGTGLVGGLLLYEDNTIQHAGVVVGFGGWADHVFKGMPPVHYGSPFVSPMVSRNVLAVTGACTAVSKATLERIGGFDEEFIICGSDVELGIRAHEAGLFNRYDANVRLYHLESKSRDSYIPEIDFKKSYEAYSPYRENVDPYFNINLDTTSVTPKERVAPMNLVNFKNYLKRSPVTARLYQVAKEALMDPQSYKIPEIEPIVARRSSVESAELRLNLLVPSVDRAHVFGGIATAIKFFEELRLSCGCSARMIVTDAPVLKDSCVAPEGYVTVSSDKDGREALQLLPMADRFCKTIPVRKGDVFVATGWWTAHIIADVIRWQKDTYGGEYKPLIYMIQDYEPGFYPWSSRYMMADSTYRLEFPTYAVFNSDLLRDFFTEKGYAFDRAWSFEPKLNETLARYLPAQGTTVEKKKQILVYGRPSTARNAFELLVYGLKAWCAQQENPEEWTVLSAGEQHDDVDLGNGVMLRSVGKLSLEEYAAMMLDTYAGVSLMVSPHPSYPPLEMASFGIKTITNRYESKDLAGFSENIVSLEACSPREIAGALCALCRQYDGTGTISVKDGYVGSGAAFGNIHNELTELLPGRTV